MRRDLDDAAALSIKRSFPMVRKKEKSVRRKIQAARRESCKSRPGTRGYTVESQMRADQLAARHNRVEKDRKKRKQAKAARKKNR